MVKVGDYRTTDYSKTGLDLSSTKTETWNVALGYVNLKILKHLIELDVLEMTSKYGKATIDEEIPEEMIIYRRIEAIQRFKDIMRQLIDNIYFTINNKQDKYRIERMRKSLDNLEDKMHAIASEEFDARSNARRVIINERFFMEILSYLQSIKRNLSTIMNRNKLIFEEEKDVSIEELFDNFAKSG